MSMAKIYARLIHAGTRTLSEVPMKYREATKAAYFEIYGEVCPEE